MIETLKAFWPSIVAIASAIYALLPTKVTPPAPVPPAPLPDDVAEAMRVLRGEVADYKRMADRDYQQLVSEVNTMQERFKELKQYVDEKLSTPDVFIPDDDPRQPGPTITEDSMNEEQTKLLGYISELYAVAAKMEGPDKDATNLALDRLAIKVLHANEK